MTRTTHHHGTVGPWEAIGRHVFQAEGVGGKQIVFHAPTKEDARLIAAAPEMLDALLVLVAHHGESGSCENCKHAETVIEKATRDPQKSSAQ